MIEIRESTPQEIKMMKLKLRQRKFSNNFWDVWDEAGDALSKMGDDAMNLI